MSSQKVDITKLDLYDIIGVSEDATEKQIVKAYRKRALKCHPDKNPDNPKAAELFNQLAKALEVLTDGAAKAAYDKILKARKAAQIRHKQYDAKRKKFKEDLDERERQAQTQKEREQDAAKNLQAEIERLRKEGSRLLEREQELLREELERKRSQLLEERNSSEEEAEEQVTAKLKVKWKLNKGDNNLSTSYTKEELTNIFSKYGEVLNVLVSLKKGGTAIVELASPDAGELAVRNEAGKGNNPLTITWLQGQPTQVPKDSSHKHGPTGDTNILSPDPTEQQAQPRSAVRTDPVVASSRDFESLVLMKMRQAEERKRLIQQMQEEDGDT